MKKSNFSVSGVFAGVVLLLGHAVAKPLPENSPQYHKKDDHGAVASEVGVCSNIGLDLLKQGGNAADAMVGTVVCIGTMAMYHSGLGGGGFVLVRTPAGKYDFIDFRETAPAASTENMYTNNTQLSLSGGLASGTPGELRGLEALHKLYGSLPWENLFKPSIKLARYGFKVSQDLVAYMDNSSGPFPFLVDDPSWAIDFAPNGTRVKLGDTMYRKRYADTLETISQRGADAFYSGAIANATIQTLKKAGGIMTLQDLAAYKVAHREPVELDYKGYKLTSCSAPSGGTVVASALNAFSGYEADFAGGVDLTTHRLIESIKFAYGQRAELGDPSFVPGLDEYQKEMVSKQVGVEVRSKISDFGVLNITAYDPKGLESLETPGTSHIVTVDKSGFALTLTTTVNLLFGSGLMVPETGVIMNNEMNDFSIPGSSNAFGYIPSEANFIKPGKRPLSSISPTIVENPDGTINLAIGAAGGSRIITATIQNVIHVLDEGLSPYEALARPRFHDQLTPNTTIFEYAYDNKTVAALQKLGHIPVWVAPGQSTAQGIKRLENGTFEAAGEPRQKNSGGFAY